MHFEMYLQSHNKSSGGMSHVIMIGGRPLKVDYMRTETETLNEITHPTFNTPTLEGNRSQSGGNMGKGIGPC